MTDKNHTKNFLIAACTNKAGYHSLISELADDWGRDFQYVNRKITGVTPCTIPNAQDIAEKFGVSIVDLIESLEITRAARLSDKEASMSTKGKG